MIWSNLTIKQLSTRNRVHSCFWVLQIPWFFMTFFHDLWHAWTLYKEGYTVQKSSPVNVLLVDRKTEALISEIGMKWQPSLTLYHTHTKLTTGSNGGMMVEALASHNVACVWISVSMPHVVWVCCGFYPFELAPRGYSLDTPVFPSPQKRTLPNFSLTRNQVHEESIIISHHRHQCHCHFHSSSSSSSLEL